MGKEGRRVDPDRRKGEREFQGWLGRQFARKRLFRGELTKARLQVMKSPFLILAVAAAFVFVAPIEFPALNSLMRKGA